MILRDKDRASLHAIFNRAAVPLEVWAYGSRVTGEAHEGSDLDLVVRTPTLEAVPADVLMQLKDDIRESNIPILVDLFDWTRLPESFHKNIAAQHEVFFSNIDKVSAR